MSVVVEKSKLERQKMPIKCSLYEACRPAVHVLPENKLDVFRTMLPDGCATQPLLPATYPLSNTVYGNAPKGSILHQQLPVKSFGIPQPKPGTFASLPLAQTSATPTGLAWPLSLKEAQTKKR